MKYRSIIIALIAAFLWTGTAFLFPAALYAAGERGQGAGELPRDLKGVRVKNAFIPSTGKPAGVIQSVVGHVIVAREGLKEAYFSATGDRLYEKDTIYTLKGSRCRLRLNGEDVVTMGEGTKIAISGFHLDKSRGTKSSTLKMGNGKAMFYALKLLRYKGAAMTVETPTAVVGVRGTKWGVEIVELDGKPTASLPILVADLSDIGFRHLAQSNQPNFQTNVYAFEGQIQVTSTVTGQTTSLGAGQGLNAGGTGLGATFQTPQDVAQQFSADTSAPGGNGGTSSSGTTTTGSTTSTTTTTAGGDTTTTPPPDTSTIAQDQTTKDASSGASDPVSDPGTNASGSQVGYVSGMLTNQTGSSLAEIFVSKNRQNFDTRIWARGAKDVTKDYIRVDTEKWTEAGDYAKWVMFDSGTKNSGDLGTSNLISHTTINEVALENYKMEWGYWTMPDAFTVDGSNYAIDNRGWWVQGPSTQNVSSLTGAFHYSGNAYGTYWSSSGGTYMTGSFSSDVNLGTGAISDFNLSVSYSELYYASISGATGTIGSDAHFSLTGGTWDLNGTTPTYQMAYGSLYGSSAQYMGGAWGMATSSAGATRIFVGKKQHLGYFVGMLFFNCDGPCFKNFSMSTTIQDFQSSSISGKDPFEDPEDPNAHSITADGSSNYQEPTIKKVTIYTGGTTPATWTGSSTVTHTSIGSNEYMEWGSWIQPGTMLIGSGNYSYDTQNLDPSDRNTLGYYIHGTQTTDAQMAALKAASVTGTYSGNAYGTYWKYNRGGGIDMTGTFSAYVDFNPGPQAYPITNFNMSVENATYGKSASITGAQGSFVGSSSQFTISGGSVSITAGTNPAHKTNGSIYGPGGQAIGGVWAISSSGAQAVGIFQGTKQTGPY